MSGNTDTLDAVALLSGERERLRGLRSRVIAIRDATQSDLYVNENARQMLSIIDARLKENERERKPLIDRLINGVKK